MSLQQKTIKGLIWSLIDNFASIFIQLVVGIILARILTPKQFGLIGLITVFLAISQTFIDGGFSNSLIKKKDCTDQDYSTVFYFNIIVSLLFYFLLFTFSKAISLYFNEPKLTDLIKIIGLGLIIKSLSSVHNTILLININFKLITKISIASTIISSLICLYLAYIGYGVWSLVIRALVGNFITTIMLWIFSKWVPKLIFDFKSLIEHFNFGYKLLFSSLINTIYENIYYLIIGKHFSPIQLGFYTRAEQFSNLASTNLTTAVQKVSYSVFSKLQDEPERLKLGYKKLIKSTMFLAFTIIIGLAAIAKPLIYLLLGSKWEQSIVYLQLICLSSMFYPLHALNLNILIFMGRTDLYLKIELIKKVISIPVIIITIFFGIKFMLLGFILLSLIDT